MFIYLIIIFVTIIIIPFIYLFIYFKNSIFKNLPNFRLPNLISYFKNSTIHVGSFKYYFRYYYYYYSIYLFILKFHL